VGRPRPDLGIALLACCCGDLWASWLVIDALQDEDDD